jgi:hypothetical protein
MRNAEIDPRFSRRAQREALRDEEGYEGQRRPRRGDIVRGAERDAQRLETVIQSTTVSWRP